MKILNHDLLYLLLSAAVGLFFIVDAQDTKYCGVALSTGHDLHGYRLPKTNGAIRQIRASGANFIQISAYLGQTSPYSMNTFQMSDDKSIVYIIRKVKRAGLKVFLKPVIETETWRGEYVWRGRIPGKNDWFKKVYIPWILRMARIAQRERVEVFSIGTEYVRTIHRTWQWLTIIKRVRSVYKGQITYIANHDSYTRAKFFNKLDFVSISAYFKLLPGLRGRSPNLATTKKLYQRRADKITRWLEWQGLSDKKVLMAEFGLQSKGNGVVYRVPWNWEAIAPLNLYEQAKMYEAFFSVFLRQEWCLGVMLWHWELEPWAGKKHPSRKWYTPQHKPAEKVLRKYFNKYC